LQGLIAAIDFGRFAAGGRAQGDAADGGSETQAARGKEEHW